MRNLFTLIVIAAVMFAASCGGGAAPIVDPVPQADVASIDGFLTQNGITERTVSTVDESVEGAEVWCEDPLNGEVLGQDQTGPDGYFLIDGLPAGRDLALMFRFRAEGGLSDVEGDTPVNLGSGERRRMELKLRQHDADGDGETDAVSGEGTGNGQPHAFQFRMRKLIGDGETMPPVPETDMITDLLLGTNPDAEPLPPLPLDEDDTAADDRGASELSGDFVVYGPDYLRMHNGTATDNSLVLDAGDHRLAWGLYRIGGLEGHDVSSLNVECAPLTDDSKYFIGVSNYSRRHWEWSGPVTATEFSFELNERSRHVSPRGNMFFLVAVFNDNSCEFFGGQAIPRDIDNDRPHPRAPIHLEASDGRTEDGVMVHWRVLPRANDAPIDNFVVMRATTDRTVSQDGDDAPDRNFEEIGNTNELEYFDGTAAEGVVYLYAVIAVSGDQRSGRSNVDRGFWVVVDDPVERFPLQGIVVTEDRNGVSGVMIVVARGDRETRTITDSEGHFAIRGLPAGMYSVTPFKRGATFTPEAARVELPMSDERLVFVARRTNDGGDGGPGDGDGGPGDGDGGPGNGDPDPR